MRHNIFVVIAVQRVMSLARRRKKPRQKNSCGTKEKLNKEDAVGKARRLQNEDGARMRAYRCIFKCYLKDGSKAWHVGHK